MKDSYGRSIDYLRISLTDKCNLRCGYCMPENGINELPHDEILTSREIVRIASIMHDMGVMKVRLTGGEPLVRRGVAGFVRELSEIPKLEIAMTTNGMRLGEFVAELKEAGLSSVNISLDTLNEDTFKRLTGADGLKSVLKGIDSAVEAGLRVKLNCVPIEGINDDEITALTGYAKEIGVPIRFIELMPIGCGIRYKGIPTDKLIARLKETYGEAKPSESKVRTESGPAVYYGFKGYRGRIGFISPMTHSFCDSCNRARLTAEGFLKLCLYHPYGLDLKTPLRSGVTDEELGRLIAEAIGNKPKAHSFGLTDMGDSRKMVQIGG